MISCEKSDIYSKDIKKQAYYNSLIHTCILPGITIPLNEDAFHSACWAIEITHFHDENFINKFKSLYPEIIDYSDETQRAFWEVINSLDIENFNMKAIDYIQNCNNAKNFAMASNFLIKKLNTDSIKYTIIDCLKNNFTSDQILQDPILISLVTQFQEKDPLPPLEDIVHHRLGDHFIIYVFLRENRNFPGIALIKDETGEWIRSGKKILTTRILGRSLANIQGTITNGNTPQGLYSVMGIDTSLNVFIGPTPTIICSLAFESSLTKFFHTAKNGDWSLEYYRSLLPNSWKGFQPIYEAFYAGMAGRSEIIMHGSTILPELYKKEAYHPLTPSLGCLTHFEKWSKKDRRLKSDQQKMVDAILSCNKQEGFMVVVEINNENRKVEYKDILQIIQ